MTAAWADDLDSTDDAWDVEAASHTVADDSPRSGMGEGMTERGTAEPGAPRPPPPWN